MPFSTHYREARAAHTQSRFREINECMKELNAELFGVVIQMGAWMCECANEACREPIQIAGDDYEAVRQDGDRFFVAPSDEHVWVDVQRIVERHHGYWIVEMIGHAQHLTMRLDPRSRSAPVSLRT